MAKGMIAMILAGVVGAAVWAGIVYGTGYEIGWVAWGIGLLVGGATAFAMGDQANAMTGLIAVIVTCASITMGKIISVEIVIEQEKGYGITEVLEPELERLRSDTEYVVSYIADDVVTEKLMNGEALNWPSGEMPEFPERRSDYPSDVWFEAQSRWTGMSAEEQDAFRQTLIANRTSDYEADVELFVESVREEGVMAMFSLMDILFYGLAIVTAYKLGSGNGAAEA
ncbi:MAG: hypothetical protein RLN76_12965 [Phycisphaeraceae bacterium]